MPLTARRAAFLAPLLVLLAVFVTHQGARVGLYRATRPDAGRHTPFYVPSDGYSVLVDGVLVNVEAPMPWYSSRLYRGTPGALVTCFKDERALVPFLQSLLGAGFVGSRVAGVFLNLVAMSAAVLCAVDLLLRLGHRPLAAGAFACLLAGGRGVGFSIGDADVHAVCFASLPIGAWLFERLELGEESVPPTRVGLMGLAAGASLLVYLGGASLLGYVWLRGLRRVPLGRLVAITAIALAVMIGWRVVGRSLGLRFSDLSTRDLPFGLARIGALVTDGWRLPENAPRGGALNELRLHGNALVQATVSFFASGRARALASILTVALVPAFGVHVLLLAALGLAARPAERRLALALALPSIALGWPMNAVFYVPRVSLPAAAGFVLAAALGLDALARFLGERARRSGASEERINTLEVLFVSVVLVLFVLHENQDVFGRTRLILGLFD